MGDFSTIDVGSNAAEEPSNHSHANPVSIETPTASSNGSTVSESFSMDSVGLLESWSFAWVRSFYVRSAPNLEVTPEESTQEDESTLNLHFADSTRPNVDAFQNAYRTEAARHGQVNASMLRVYWSLCRHRILWANGAYMLAATIGMVAITIFLRLIMEFTNQEWEDRRAFHRALPLHKVAIFEVSNLVKHVHSSIFVVLMVAMYATRSVYHSIVLRTAIAMRNACAGAVYESCLKSSVQKYVASYQVMVFCAEDGDAIMEMIQKGSTIVAQTCAILACIVCTSFIFGAAIFYAIIGLAIVLLIAYVLSLWSAQYYRKSQSFLHQKLFVTDEFGRHTNEVFDNRDIYKNRFSAAVSGQYWALFRSESLRPSFSGGVTVALLLFLVTICTAFSTGLYTEYSVQTANIMTVIFLFLYLMHLFVTDWSDGLMALTKGMVVLDKVKSIIGRDETIVPFQEPDNKTMQIHLKDATFAWEIRPKTILDKENELETIEKPDFVLRVSSLEVQRNTIIGVTADDEAALSCFVHALLGHMPQKDGVFQRRGPILYFPETPFLLDKGSVRENIVFNSAVQINESKYQETLATLQLYLNADFELAGTDRSQLDMQMQQKISLARALYDERVSTILLENPLSSLDSNTTISDLFADVCIKCHQQGKSVIVVSQDDNVLRHCQRVHILDKGQMTAGCSYDEVKENSAYKDIIRNYQNDRYENRIGSTSSNLQTVLDISTEDLVEVAPAVPNTVIFNPAETCYLALLSIFNVCIQIAIPAGDFLFIMELKWHNTYFLIIPTIVILILLVGSTMLVKHYVHRIGRRYTKRLHREVFANVLNISRTEANESLTVHILNMFMESNFRAFQTRYASIYSWMVVLAALVGLFAVQFYRGLVMILLVVQFIALFYGARHTIAAVGRKQIKGRERLFETVHNEINGRSVIQSFDLVHQSRIRIFELIDANSSTIYLGKAVIYFTHSIFTVFQLINIGMLLVAVHNDYFKSDYTYVITLYIFFLLSHHIVALLECRLEKIIADQRLSKAQEGYNKVL